MPVSPLSILPGVAEKVSQIDGARPSSSTAPSIWYAAVAAPQPNCGGNSYGSAAEPTDVTGARSVLVVVVMAHRAAATRRLALPPRVGSKTDVVAASRTPAST